MRNADYLAITTATNHSSFSLARRPNIYFIHMILNHARSTHSIALTYVSIKSYVHH